MAETKAKDTYARSPTLETVMMVERFIDEKSGDFNRTELWKRLPKKVMWQTYLVVLSYLESINKIAFDRQDRIVYIWNPRLTRRLRSRKEIEI